MKKSIRRNRLIADAFFMAGLIEKWGSGTTRIARELNSAGMPDPNFTFDQHRFQVGFYRSADQTQSVKELSTLHEKIIKILAMHDKGLNIFQILGKLEEDISSRTLRKHLTQLKKLGYIENRGRGKYLVWLQLS